MSIEFSMDGHQAEGGKALEGVCVVCRRRKKKRAGLIDRPSFYDYGVFFRRRVL